MADFRYAQFCPLARAAELIGERWTLLVIRELLTGPQRFSELKRRLEGISSSVLASRFGAHQGLVVLALARGDLDPGTALEQMECEGDRAALADFPRLFDLSVESPESTR